jgi:hypothetical protein
VNEGSTNAGPTSTSRRVPVCHAKQTVGWYGKHMNFVWAIADDEFTSGTRALSAEAMCGATQKELAQRSKEGQQFTGTLDRAERQLRSGARLFEPTNLRKLELLVEPQLRSADITPRLLKALHDLLRYGARWLDVRTTSHRCLLFNSACRSAHRVIEPPDPSGRCPLRLDTGCPYRLFPVQNRQTATAVGSVVRPLTSGRRSRQAAAAHGRPLWRAPEPRGSAKRALRWAKQFSSARPFSSDASCAGGQGCA